MDSVSTFTQLRSFGFFLSGSIDLDENNHGGMYVAITSLAKHTINHLKPLVEELDTETWLCSMLNGQPITNTWYQNTALSAANCSY